MRRGPPERIRLRWRAALAVLIFLCATLAYGQRPSEYQIKAVFLYNFAKFVDWPTEAFPTSTAPIQLCLLRDNPFGSDLQQVVEGKAIAGHPVTITVVTSERQARSCHILFISATQSKQAKQLLDGLRGASVLTVGETEGFAREGGIINFVLADERVRFEVNHKAAGQARLSISSKLLVVAKLVID